MTPFDSQTFLLDLDVHQMLPQSLSAMTAYWAALDALWNGVAVGSSLHDAAICDCTEDL